MDDADHYAVLGVARDASPVEVKRAFRELTLRWHPDRHPGDDDAQARFARITQAWETLGDPASRAAYDRARLAQVGARLGQGGAGGAVEAVSNTVADLFGRNRSRARRGRDVRYTLTLELRDAVLGCERTISFEAPGPCDACGGSGTGPGGRAPVRCDRCAGAGSVRGVTALLREPCGRCDGTGMRQLDPCVRCSGRGTRRRVREFDVRVPAGTTAGEQRVIPGQGEPGRYGGDAGDLVVKIAVREGGPLSREGASIRSVSAVPWSTLVFGGTIVVQTVDGEVSARVPEGTSPGATLRLRGRGVPRDGHPRGDHLVRLELAMPALVELSPPQRDAARAQLLAAERALLGPRSFAAADAAHGADAAQGTAPTPDPDSDDPHV